MIMQPIDVLTAIAGFAAVNADKSSDRPIKLATIDPAYVASTFPGTLPKVTFDGESTLSTKFYPVASPYWPHPSNRVWMVPIGNTYLIAGSHDPANSSAYVGGNLGGSLDVDPPSVAVIDSFDGGSGTTVTEIFSSIDQSYDHLLMLWRGRSSDAANNAASLSLRFNGDDGTNYFSETARTAASAWSHVASSNTTSVRCGYVGGQRGTTGIIHIPDYAGSGGVWTKSAWGMGMARGVGGNSTITCVNIGGGYWSSSSPITSIEMWPAGFNWSDGLRVTLIGVRNP